MVIPYKYDDDMDDNEEKVFKHNPAGFRQEIQNDVQAHMEKFKDPVVLGELMYKLLEERENTNRILKNILLKLEKIQHKEQATSIKNEIEETLLPEVDEQIVNLVKDMKAVTANDVKNKLGYRGTNGASSRLNRLVDVGVLKKKQIGKKVFFFLES